MTVSLPLTIGCCLNPLDSPLFGSDLSEEIGWRGLLYKDDLGTLAASYLKCQYGRFSAINELLQMQDHSKIATFLGPDVITVEGTYHVNTSKIMTIIDELANILGRTIFWSATCQFPTQSVSGFPEPAEEPGWAIDHGLIQGQRHLIDL